jgi:hypothetical protein
MTHVQRALLAAFGALLLSACEPRQTVETEIYIGELEAYVGDLEGELYHDRTEMARLSATLANNLRDLELAIAEVDRRVLDLRSGGDVLYTVPEVEAAVMVAKQRLSAAQTTTGEISRNVDAWRE